MSAPAAAARISPRRAAEPPENRKPSGAEMAAEAGRIERARAAVPRPSRYPTEAEIAARARSAPLRGQRRELGAGPFGDLIGSFELHLLAERKSPKTVRTYCEAAQWLAAAQLRPAGLASWDEVTAKDVQRWTVRLAAEYSDSYANNQFRALQQFFKWHATEDPDEPRPNPMANLKPPKVGDKLVPVFTGDELTAMLATCKGGGFQNRRDYAVISLFKDAGIRLSELAGLSLDDVSPVSREATVTGKGNKQRTVRFTYDTARARPVLARAGQAPHGASLGAVARRARRPDDSQRRLPDDRTARPGGRR